jgi:hypothetical protein
LAAILRRPCTHPPGLFLDVPGVVLAHHNPVLVGDLSLTNSPWHRRQIVVQIRLSWGKQMIRIAAAIAIAVSASACTSQANVAYDTSKKTCRTYVDPGTGRKRELCLPDTPNKHCVRSYYIYTPSRDMITCGPLTRKATTAEGRARQLAGSRYP